jgi:hypothetical protein
MLPSVAEQLTIDQLKIEKFLLQSFNVQIGQSSIQNLTVTPPSIRLGGRTTSSSS